MSKPRRIAAAAATVVVVLVMGLVIAHIFADQYAIDTRNRDSARQVVTHAGIPATETPGPIGFRWQQ